MPKSTARPRFDRPAPCAAWLRHCWLWVLALILSLPALAIEVDGLYRGSAVVGSRSDERERVQAFQPAMREVLLKVTGRAEVLQEAPIRQALSNAQRYVASWSYGTRRDATGEDSIVLEVIFYESEIQSLLENSGVPIWPRNRPETLLWVVMQDELGERQVLGSDAQDEVIAALRAEAARRGLPVLFPLMDLQDRLQINAQQLWNLDEEAVRAASARYHAESILTLRAYRSLGGELVGEAIFLFRGQPLHLDLYETDLAAFLEAPLELAARELSSHYAVLLSGASGSVPVSLTVQGIASAEAYAGVLRYVADLADVNAMNLVSVEGDTMTLSLRTGGQIRQLVETIALNNDLQPVAEVTREGSELFLRYRWVGR